MMDPWDVAKVLLDLAFQFARGTLTSDGLVVELRKVIDRLLDAVEEEKLG